MPSTPFQLIVTGKAEISHPAERAIINVSVSSSGINRASVSDKVITTAEHIESLLGDLSPRDHETAPLDHWSKTPFSSTSHVPYNHKDPDTPLARQYNAVITFEIRFRDFEVLESFGSEVSSLGHVVEVQNISWILTDETLESLKTQLRQQAARDARRKARDYCVVLAPHTNVPAVELQEGDARSTMSAGFVGGGAGNGIFGGGGYYEGSGVAAQSAQAATVSRSIQQARRGVGDGQDARTEDLGFDAQKVKLAIEVTAKFQVD